MRYELTRIAEIFCCLFLVGVMVVVAVVTFATPVALFIWGVYLILKALGVFA
uniref:hypothetical protein n=1 Tax=Parasutterella excrementihominis TaxID=487175 RepID=UPI00206167FE|nr:MAG TPA: hypothetical protein [Caudoviricetes sp.]